MAAENEDSLLLIRVLKYQPLESEEQLEGYQTNVYIKHYYDIDRRNFLLWLVPSMHSVAKGRRTFFSEQYSRFTFNDIDDYTNRRQVLYSTIPHNRTAMPTLLEFVTPNLYRPTIYNDHILSPFNYENRLYYKYGVTRYYGWLARIHFRPRFINNTQLVTGQALVDSNTGRILQVEMSGEFDMIRFKTTSMQGEKGTPSLLPRLTKTDIEFRFMGNRIKSHFEAVFDCPITLPDSVNIKGNRQLIDSVRPIDLSPDEAAIYAEYDSLYPAATMPASVNSSVNSSVPAVGGDLQSPTAPADSVDEPHRHRRDIDWDDIGERLIRPLRTSNDYVNLKLSPIINPQYISYSHRKGFSYKMRLRSRFFLGDETVLRFDPTVGYNFKLHKFYYTVPFRLDYNIKREAHCDLVWGNGNRIGNSSVLEEIRQEMGDLPELEEKNLDAFDHMYLKAFNSIKVASWLWTEAGVVFHQRKAVNPHAMTQYGKPKEYRSLAPTLSVRLRPLKHGPMITVDYERGMKTHNPDHHYTDLEYERWEGDISMKHKMSRLQTLNLRFGGGFYSRKDKNYFMDFANFRDENLPEGWDDDWSGDFQLLSSRLYNASNYYVRGNISYESPLLLASLVPVVGRYVERERAYVNSLLIQNTRPYSELGYGFTCRYFSVGVFASFFGLKYEEMGAKFTFELFRRW